MMNKITIPSSQEHDGGMKYKIKYSTYKLDYLEINTELLI